VRPSGEDLELAVGEVRGQAPGILA
jgi:hypothetical protein